MHDLDPGIWTPKLVGEELVAAIRWVNKTGGAVGPGRVKSAWPEIARMADPDFDGWPPMADDDARPLRIQLSPKRVSQFERIIEWQGRYLADTQPGAGRVLKVWVRSKLTKRMTFEKAGELVGWSRATAYRGRDRALSGIAIGLTRDGISFGSH